MTHNEASDLMIDWGRNLSSIDFCETLYLSINGIGTKVFKSCLFHEQDNYLFIWTKDESFLLDRNELGDFIIVSNPTQSILSTKVI